MKNHLLKRLFGIKYPIIQAPMAGGITTPNLVSSVCNSDALGFLASGYLNSRDLEKQIHETKRLTQKPFGVNIFISEKISNLKVNKQKTLLRLEQEINLNTNKFTVDVDIDEEIDKKINLIIENKVPIASFTFGIPNSDQIKRLKDNSVFMIGTACNLTEARVLQTRKFDAIVLQGSEAGGHRGSFLSEFESDEIGLLALLQEVQRSIEIPFIASGGIATGEAMLSSFILGAQAVQIGTGFIMTNESGASDVNKKYLSSTKPENTIITNIFSGKKARGVLNKMAKEFIMQEEKVELYPIQNSLTKDIRTHASKSKNPEYQSIWCGQGISVLKDQPVSNFINRIISEYNEALDNTNNLRF